MKAVDLFFGAIFGQGEGLQGDSYAIPTMQEGVETIKPYIDEFIDFAKNRPDLTSYVIKIGHPEYPELQEERKGVSIRTPQMTIRPDCPLTLNFNKVARGKIADKSCHSENNA